MISRVVSATELVFPLNKRKSRHRCDRVKVSVCSGGVSHLRGFSKREVRPSLCYVLHRGHSAWGLEGSLLKTTRPRRAWQETHVNRKGFPPSGITLGSTLLNRTPSRQRGVDRSPWSSRRNRPRTCPSAVSRLRTGQNVKEAKLLPGIRLGASRRVRSARRAPRVLPGGTCWAVGNRSLLRVRVTSLAAARDTCGPSSFRPSPGLSPLCWPPCSCSRLCLPSARFLLQAVVSQARPQQHGLQALPCANQPVHVFTASPSSELQPRETDVR